jgi:DNA repair protein RadC
LSIRDWPDQDRPREKLLQRGAGALSDAELLAIFLRTGVRGCSAVDLARNLLQTHGGLKHLFEADQASFCRTRGLGMAKYVQLQAVLEMGRRYLEEGLRRGEELTSVAATRRYLKAQLYHEPHEVFACLFLDNRHRVLAFEPMFYGTIDGASVHPRQVIKRALYHNAAALILAHNHPSGIAEPSAADCQITRRLSEALELIDVRLLDHVIIGEGEPVSLAERGLL